MGKFTEEEIQLAGKHEILFYTINREMQSRREIHTLNKSVIILILKWTHFHPAISIS